MDKKKKSLVVLLLISFGQVLMIGCSGGGSSNSNSSNSNGSSSSGCNSSTVASGFPVEATGVFSGELGDLPLRIGNINFFVNSSGIVESGTMQFPNGATIRWSPSIPWPAGNPGVNSDRFLTTDCSNGGQETFQGVFNSISGEWSGTYGAGDLYPIVGGTSGSFLVRKTANALRAAAAAPTKLQGQLFAAPGAAPYEATLSLYADQSAVVTATSSNGETIMVVGKQVRPKGERTLTKPAGR